MTVTDQTLRAYIDGHLGAAEAEALEAQIALDADLEARLMSLDPIAGAVHGAFDGLPSDARLDTVTANILTNDVSSGTRSGWQALAATAAASAVIGFGLAYALIDRSPLSWQEQIAAYQVLYVQETVAALEPNEGALSAQFTAAETALGTSLHREGLSSLDGLNLRRAQILGIDGAPLVQVAFAGTDGTPIAFCIVRLDGSAAEHPPEFQTLSGLSAAHWSSGGLGYMLIGGTDGAMIERLTQEIQNLFS